MIFSFLSFLYPYLLYYLYEEASGYCSDCYIQHNRKFAHGDRFQGCRQLKATMDGKQVIKCLIFREMERKEKWISRTTTHRNHHFARWLILLYQLLLEPMHPAQHIGMRQPQSQWTSVYQSHWV